MLLGSWHTAIDVEAILELPQHFRASLGAEIVATCGFERCIQVMRIGDWRELSGRVSGLPLGMNQARDLRRLLFADAALLTLDASGRIRLPPRLRAYAGLDKDVVVAGLNSYLEIWAAERWRLAIDNTFGDARQLASVLL